MKQIREMLEKTMELHNDIMDLNIDVIIRSDIGNCFTRDEARKNNTLTAKLLKLYHIIYAYTYEMENEFKKDFKEVCNHKKKK